MTKEELINSLIKDGYLKTPAIIEAFNKIDRKDFVPEAVKDSAYENTALPIGEGQTISQPLVVAFMLELLELKAGERVLEIGSGSAWNTALMAELVRPKPRLSEVLGENGKPQSNAERTQTNAEGLVVSIERIPELHEFAKTNLSKYNLLSSLPAEIQRDSALGQRVPAALVKLMQGDGSRGFPEQAPFDKIIAAAAGEEIPEAWKEQLKIGGRIVAPVKDSIVVLNKISKDQFEKKEYFGFSFVPLIKD